MCKNVHLLIRRFIAVLEAAQMISRAWTGYAALRASLQRLCSWLDPFLDFGFQILSIECFYWLTRHVELLFRRKLFSPWFSPWYLLAMCQSSFTYSGSHWLLATNQQLSPNHEGTRPVASSSTQSQRKQYCTKKVLELRLHMDLNDYHAKPPIGKEDEKTVVWLD